MCFCWRDLSKECKGDYKDCTDCVLDKIRAEILKLDDINPDYPMDMTIHISRNEVLEIIDKYKTGSKVE